MKYKIFISIILILLPGIQCFCQNQKFTRFDSLRGSLSPLRSNYDVYYYDLHLDIDINKKFIIGNNVIFYSSTNDFNEIQVDLFKNYSIDSIVYQHEKLNFRRDSNAVFIRFNSLQKRNQKNYFTVYYSGNPITAKNPPWDGGFIWDKDSLGKPWVGVACEGMGASSWWPCKDHPTDEPDSMRMSFSIPSDLSCVSNGNLIDKKIFNNSKTTYTWSVAHPINIYNITLNIANYLHFSEDYVRNDGSNLMLDYYVLSYNLPKAEKHFKQVKKILQAYESFFGNYPFPKDGYALVETPYWGMEHQSAVSYGNNYTNQLKDLDFIIVHETAHEWWGNSVTASDMGELWIHESFATYAESLLLEKYYGYENSLKYLEYQKQKIKNKFPLIKPLNVNFFRSEDSDIYYKGAWMLHTVRNIISNDTLWFKIIYDIANHFKHSIVTTEQIVEYFDANSNINLTPVFEQYLKYSNIPVFEYSLRNKGKKTLLSYKWKADVKNFNMPLMVELKDKKIKLTPTASVQTLKLKTKEVENFRVMTELFYIKAEQIIPNEK